MKNMNEQKCYRDDLLEWCEAVELNWDSLKPRFSKLFDVEIIQEWEDSCRQLKAKLQEDIKTDIKEYETAIILYEQWEWLYRESIAYPEEIEVVSEIHMERDEQIPLDEQSLETDAHHEETEIQLEQYMNIEDLNKYRDDLLKWSHKLYSNWNKSKHRLSNTVDIESLEGWEEMYAQLIEKLQEDLPVDYEDYETANTLYEQWKNLLDESYSAQNVIEVG